MEPYSEKVMEHFRNPRNVGEIPDADGVGKVGNPVCVVPGTLIKCNDDLVPIKDIAEGKTRVLGHDGKYHKAARVFKRRYRGKVLNIYADDRDCISLTSGHHVLSVRSCMEKNKRDEIYDWFLPEELKKGDRLLLPIHKYKKARMQNEPKNVPTWGKDFYYKRINEITTSQYDGYVYDIEVERVHSYVTKCATLHNCGDIMNLYIKVVDGIIVDAKFKTFGCGAAISTSSMVTELVKGKPIDEALKISNKAVAEALGGLPKIKMHCSVLAEEALQSAIKDYYERRGIKKELPPLHDDHHNHEGDS